MIFNTFKNHNDYINLYEKLEEKVINLLTACLCITNQEKDCTILDKKCHKSTKLTLLEVAFLVKWQPPPCRTAALGRAYSNIDCMDNALKSLYQRCHEETSPKSPLYSKSLSKFNI